MGLILISEGAPTPSCVADVSDNRLASVVDVNVFNADGLFATAPEFR
jgi:hypothetical protein